MARLFPSDGASVTSIRAQLDYVATIPRAGLRASNASQALTREQLSHLLETAFWASLPSNEGRNTRVRITVANPGEAPGAMAFESPIKYEEREIVRVSPAVAKDGSLLVTSRDRGFLIWGIANGDVRTTELDILAIEISEPGMLRINIGPYQPYSILNGRDDSTIAAIGSDLAHFLQQKLKKTLPSDDVSEVQAIWRECLALARLAKTILEHGHGGTILIVPDETGQWQQALQPFACRLERADTAVRDAIRREVEDMFSHGEIIQQLSGMGIPPDLLHRILTTLGPRSGGMWGHLHAIASMADVDGAVVMTRDLRLLGFAAKIVTPPDILDHVCMFKPQGGVQEVVRSPLEALGGTRHQSAARFVAAHREALALVVSQDRHVSLMTWEESPVSTVGVVKDAQLWV